MEITLEQADHLREKAGVSYAQAKEALEYSGGNLLDALIYLEERGVIPRPQGAGYSTRPEAPPPLFAPVPPAQETKRRPGIFTRLRWFLLDNELEIWRRGQPVTALPVLILILLIFSVYWLTLPLLVLGLFLGFRYRFSGPDLEREEINGAMDTAADTAESLGRRVAEELRARHERRSQTDEEG